MGVTARGSGNAKLLLFGEHAAVYGLPALGLSLPERLDVELELGGAGWRLEGARSVDSSVTGTLFSALTILADSLPVLAQGGTVRIRSGVPQGLGLGSSAALCVALAEAALRLQLSPDSGAGPGQLPAPERERVWALAHAAETAFHGRPSGIDTGLSALEGLLRFEPDPPALPRAKRLRCPPLHLVVGALPRRAPTAQLIAGLRSRRAADAKAAAAIETLGRLAVQASTLLAEGAVDVRRLGLLADEAQELLDYLGLGDPQLRELLVAGKAAGALGGKLSGAGGGGSFFLVFADAAAARQGAGELEKRCETLGITLAWPARALCLGEGGS